MNQRKLYRTIEGLSPERFDTSDELLSHLLDEIVKHEGINMKGGRIWKLNPRKKGIQGYAATGIGEKVKVRNVLLYPYILAFNSDPKEDRILDTLNIVS